MGAPTALAKLRHMVARRGAAGLAEWIGDFAFWRAYHARLAYRRIVWSAIRRRSRGGPIITNAQGLRMHLNPEDIGLSMELAVERVHEPLLSVLWQALIHPGMTVVDVGANLGYFALLAARNVGPEGRVVAIEPAPASARLLRANVDEARAANVTVLECAVGDTRGRQRLFVFDQANWNSLVPREGAAYGVDVEVFALDQILLGEPRVDVVRLDVEGYEGRVLAGMTSVLAVHLPFVVMELHASAMTGEQIDGVLDPARRAGYGVRWAYPRRWEEVLWRRSPGDRVSAATRLTSGAALPMDHLTKLTENYSVCLQPPGGAPPRVSSRAG